MKRAPGERRCTYLVTMDGSAVPLDELRDFAEYLALVGSTDIDVVVVDGSAPEVFEENRRVLRWVSRHMPARVQHRGAAGSIDPVRTAIEVAACDKVIIAGEDIRYCADSLDDMCDLLDVHEVVEPQDYYDPMPWWGGIDAGRMLVHRGIHPMPDKGSTFGFRRGAIRGLRSIDRAEVLSAGDVFVRRIPPIFDEWLRQRPAHADVDFVIPAKAIFFMSLIPVAIALALLGGAGAVTGYTGAIAVGAVALAARGRNGAAPFFPWRACLFAPLWVLERSITVHWALWRRLMTPNAPNAVAAEAGPAVPPAGVARPISR
jgi:hypothetical protein